MEGLWEVVEGDCSIMVDPTDGANAVLYYYYVLRGSMAALDIVFSRIYSITDAMLIYLQI